MEESSLDGYTPKVINLKDRAKEMKSRVLRCIKSATGKITGDVLKSMDLDDRLLPVRKKLQEF